MKEVRIALGIGAVALLIATLGPWVNVFGGLVSVGPTVNAEIAIVTFGGIASIAAIAYWRPLALWARIVVGVLGLAVVAEAAWALSQISDLKSEAGDWGAELVTPGWGVYLAVITGLYLIGAAIYAHVVSRRDPVYLVDGTKAEVTG
jgi:hypothetical protein